MYVQRVSIYPQLGKERELQHHLESWVKAGQGQGRKVGLAMQVFAPEGVVFVITVRLNDLAEFEQLRQHNRTNQAFQDFLTKNAALSRLPAKIELLESLVPLPS